MRQGAKAFRLRIFLSENDKYMGYPLYEEIVVQAHQIELAEVTVFRGVMGYGESGGLNIGKYLKVSKDLPIVIEILDSEAKINGFLELLAQLLVSGIAMIEPVRLYRFNNK